MYKIGDNLLCIESSDYYRSNNVKKGTIYTITEVINKSYDIYYKINDGSREFGANSLHSRRFRFITLKEIQKLKIICSKQEIE